MNAVKENVVGLVKFLGLLFRAFRSSSRNQEWEQSSRLPETAKALDKYKQITGGPSEPLTSTETKFCPRCHVPVAQVRHTNLGTQIIKHGKVLVTAGGNMSITEEWRELKGFPIKCPNGHAVRIE